MNGTNNKKQNNTVEITQFQLAIFTIRNLKLDTMKIGVVGSREFDDYTKLENELNKIKGITEIVSGGARGADTLAERFVENNKIKFTKFTPDY